MSIIKDDILYPRNPKERFDISVFGGKSLVELLFERIEDELTETGDRRWLTNGVKEATGRSRAFGEVTFGVNGLKFAN